VSKRYIKNGCLEGRQQVDEYKDPLIAITIDCHLLIKDSMKRKVERYENSTQGSEMILSNFFERVR
jgi:hypothetical protein